MSPVFRFVLSLTAFLVSLSLCRLHPSSCLSFWIQRVSQPIPRQISEIDKRQNFYRTHVAVLAPCTFPILHRTACSQAQCRPLHPSVFFFCTNIDRSLIAEHSIWTSVNLKRLANTLACIITETRSLTNSWIILAKNIEYCWEASESLRGRLEIIRTRR
jgi:hypothetical protein